MTEQATTRRGGQPDSGRVGWIDSVRGLAVLLVIVWHVPSIPAVLGGSTPGWAHIFSGLQPFRIPTLLFLSGMFVSRSLAKGLRPYYWGKLRNVAWPYILWLVLTTLTLSDDPVAVLTGKWTWVGGPWHLWFLAVLLACYLAGPITRLVPAWLWPIPMVLLSAVPSTNAYARILWFGAFFYAGCALGKYLEKWRTVHPAFGLGAVGISIAWAVYVALNPSGAPRTERLEYFVLSLIGVAAIIWVMSRLPRSRWLENAGEHSIILYLVHFPAIGLAYLALDRLGWSESILLYPLLLAVGIGVPRLLFPLRNSLLFTLPSAASRSGGSAP